MPARPRRWRRAPSARCEATGCAARDISRLISAGQGDLRTRFHPRSRLHSPTSARRSPREWGSVAGLWGSFASSCGFSAHVPVPEVLDGRAADPERRPEKRGRGQVVEAALRTIASRSGRTATDAAPTKPIRCRPWPCPALLAAPRSPDLIPGDEPEDDRQHRPDSARDPPMMAVTRLAIANRWWTVRADGPRRATRRVGTPPADTRRRVTGGGRVPGRRVSRRRAPGRGDRGRAARTDRRPAVGGGPGGARGAARPCVGVIPRQSAGAPARLISARLRADPGRGRRDVPHFPQKRRLSLISAPQFGHVIVASVPTCAALSSRCPSWRRCPRRTRA